MSAAAFVSFFFLMLRCPPTSTLFPYTTLFRSEGYTVAVARSGEEGLDFATNQAPDLVVLDVRLPGIDGFEVLRRLRAGGPDRKSTRLNSSHSQISYAVFCLKKKKETINLTIKQ